jgi:hypothetical protein
MSRYGHIVPERNVIEIGWSGAYLDRNRDLWSLPLGAGDRNRLATGPAQRRPAAAQAVRTRVHEFVHDAIRAVGFAQVTGLVEPSAPEGEIVNTLLFVLDGLGTVVPQNGRGEVIQVLRDQDGDSATALGFHCDTCDLLVLLCLRPAALGSGHTRLACARRVHDILRREQPGALAALRRNWTYDRTGRAGPQLLVSPILFTQEDGTIGCYYQTRTVRRPPPGSRPLDDTQLRALAALDEVLARPDVAFDLLLAAGDLLIIRNSRVLHGRSAYVDLPEPNSRRMLRIWMDVERR